ncbi:hypothetical protein ACXIUS_17790 [Bosea thiooxidans]|nr:hypothetical protein [Bosea sp. (in: a-proteobacteria)]
MLPFIDFADVPTDLGTPAWLADTDPALAAGIWRFQDARNELALGENTHAALTYDTASFPHHEFTLVLEGELRLAHAAAPDMLVGPGEAVVIPRGLAVRLEQSAGSRRLRMIYRGEAPKAAPAGVVRIAPFGPLGPGNAPAVDVVLTSPPPTARSRTDFTDETGRFMAGVWRVDAYRRMPLPAGQHELAHILEGTPDIDAPDGTRLRSFPPGQTFFTAKGAIYSLGGSEAFQKLFCVLRPAS